MATAEVKVTVDAEMIRRQLQSIEDGRERRRKQVVAWCEAQGIDANKVARSDAQFLKVTETGAISFGYREYLVNDEGRRELCRCDDDCAPTHYKGRRHFLIDVPRPDFWPDDDSVFLDLDRYIDFGH